jgi:hypothetical protein
VIVRCPDAAHTDGIRERWFVALRSRLRDGFLVLCVRLQHELTEAVFRTPVVDGAQQREVASFAVDHERSRRERDVATGPVALLPDAEAEQLQAIQLAADELQFGVRELVLGFVLLVANDVDRDSSGIPPLTGARLAKLRASPVFHTKHTCCVRSFNYLCGEEPLGVMAQAAVATLRRLWNGRS